MTYGVDQCRMCGVPIPERPLTARDLKMFMIVSKSKKPLLTEKEWRARGFKAQPTRWQMAEPAAGCCYDCGKKLSLKRDNYSWRVIRVFLMLFMLGTALTLGYLVTLN